MRGLITPARALLAAILLAGFALRIWNLDYGLPYVWSFDEGHHFASRAVRMFYGGGYDTDYFDNPSAYAYMIHFLLRGMYGAPLRLFDLDYSNITEQFYVDPTEIWIASRALAAALCMVGVIGVYLAASRIWGRREGLVAAALLGFAFLPVVYSRVAVTDVGALLGVALGVLGAVKALEDGRLRWYALAGIGAGLAIAFKYTAGLVLLPVGIAGLARLRRDRGNALAGVALAAGIAGLVFLAANPYALISFDEFREDVFDQAEVAADEEKPGQGGNGFSYYLDSLTWGFGWLAAFAALAGAVIETRRDRARGLLLLSMPLALFLYLGLQSRYFGRWLLPAYPVLAMLGAVALVRAAELVPRPGARTAALAGLTALVLAQSVAADVRTARVLGRDDTREQARDFLTETYPPELRAVIEPDVPGRYLRIAPDGDLPPYIRRCAGGRAYEYTDENGRDYCIRPRRAGALGRRPGQFPRAAGGIRASAWHLVLDAGRDRRLPPLRLLHGRDHGHGARARDRDRPAGGARLLRAARPRVRGDRGLQPLRRPRRARAIQLRPVLQLLPTRVPPARADGGHPPPARLRAALWAVADPGAQAAGAAPAPADRCPLLGPALPSAPPWTHP